MDKSRHDIEAEIERTLRVAEDIKRVTGNPFLYTRIQERMKQGETRTRHKLSAVWGVAFATLLLLINLSSAFVYYQKSVRADQAAGIEAIASEYGLVDQEEWEY